MDFVLWPFLFLCLNGCYGPPQTLRGQVERLPDSAVIVAASSAVQPATDDDLVRLAKEIPDPLAWAARVGRFDFKPSRVIELKARGVPVAHLDALYAAEMRAREADSASRVADREQQLARHYDEDLRHLERMQAPPYVPSPYPYGGPYPYPGTPWGAPLVGPWPYWR